MANQSPETPHEKPAAAPPARPSATLGLPTAREPHLFDRISVLYKYRWAAITTFLLVTGWVMVDSYTKLPIYRATARVLIEDPTSAVAATDVQRNVTSADPEIYMATQLRIMKGRELGERVAKQLDLSKVGEFNGKGPKPTQLAKGIAAIKFYAAWPYRLITTASAPPATPPASDVEVVSPANYPDALLARMNPSQVRGSQLVDIAFESSDPAFAATAVNAFADEYVTQNLSGKVGALEKSVDWLHSEVEKQAELTKQSELQMAQYREKQGAESLDNNQNIVIAQLTAVNDSYTKARTERITKEGLWRQISAMGNDVESISSVVSNTAVQNLRAQINGLQQDRSRISERYGEKHPDFISVNAKLANAQRQLDAEIQKAIQNAKNDFDASVTQERVLQDSLNQAKSAAAALGRKGVDYSVLSREAESNRTILNQLLTKEKELRVEANSRTNNVRVIDRAPVPTTPFSPNHRSDWVYAIAVGLALGLGLAFGIDYLDDTVKTPEDVTRRLHLKFLGLVPIVGGERHPLISGPVPHDFGEAYRSIRTALAAALPASGSRVVAVASSQPLEGKTTTAVNIAMALAVGGSRVLLIDADMRRPSVHKALRMTNDRGLSQLLAGQARMREVVQRTHDPNLLTITAGRTPANPSELLASDRMRALIAGLENGPFDWIIIDTPPVLAVTDAVILAPLVSAVTFVIGAEMTRWRLAERAVETLLSSNPRQMLAVLNKVNFGRNKYYYSRYYGHQYKNYYAESPAA
jgi:capsular exopolysaccharide synthesis family protein